MTIKFICTCGKHLRARDDMASRRSVCPRCGSPVGIPSLKPTHPGVPAVSPLTPLERMHLARERAPLTAAKPDSAPERPTPVAPRPPDPRLVRLISTHAVRRRELRGRYLERTWQQCLLYPLRAWRLCLGLAVLLAALTAGLAVFLPFLLDESPANPLSLAGLRLLAVLLPLLALSIPCAFLDCVLDSSTAGEVYYIVWSGNPILSVVRSGTKWLASFLAGPILFAGACWFYWLRCGDPGIIDWLILTELGVVSLAYWIFALLAVSDRGRLQDLNPVTVADLANRLGRRGLGVVLLAALLLLVHGWVLIAGVAGIHLASVNGWLMLGVGWLSGIFWSTFFCRLLGVWCHGSRVAAE
jgi:hypothetical protein